VDKRTFLIVGRLLFGLLTLVAIAAQLVTHLQHGFDIVNFFGYFTNPSNIFASVVFIIGAVYLVQNREPTVTEDLIRGASVVAMAIVGIVFSVLLRDVDLGTLAPWVNTVVHFVMPVVVVADWLYQPPKSKLTMRQTLYWLIYPLLYLLYTLTRGAITGFYPYPFLNPNTIPGHSTAGSYGAVALYCIAIFVAFLIVGAILVWLGNTLKRNVA
jgi:hypothetical protein